MQKPEPTAAIPVALANCNESMGPDAVRAICQTLEAAALPLRSGMHVLVKPNLLQARELACASPFVVCEICKWLLEHGIRIKVADSPGFGRAANVAAAIGLTRLLRPLGLGIEDLKKPVYTRLELPGNIALPISATALECEMILSIARIKAHKQMRITMTVKNCFGCLPGLRKALVHARYGQKRDFFADVLAALWAALPPVAGFADGIVAMSVTGPVNGEPCPLNMIGASASAAALDASILQALNIDPALVPLEMALRRRGMEPNVAYPLLQPDDFKAGDFKIPAELAPTSFHPAQLAKSLGRRILRLLVPPAATGRHHRH